MRKAKLRALLYQVGELNERELDSRRRDPLTSHIPAVVLARSAAERHPSTLVYLQPNALAYAKWFQRHRPPPALQVPASSAYRGLLARRPPGGSPWLLVATGAFSIENDDDRHIA